MAYAYMSSYTSDVPFTIKAFGVALREAREAKQIGRDKLAAKIGVAKSTIQSWESGAKVPKVTNVAKVLEVLDVTMSEFFGTLEGSLRTDTTEFVKESGLQKSVRRLQDAAVGEVDPDAASHFESQADALARALVRFVKSVTIYLTHRQGCR